MTMIMGDDAPAGTAQPAAEPARPPVQVEGMWDLERQHPGRMAVLYALAMLAGLLGHHVVGWLALLMGGAA